MSIALVVTRGFGNGTFNGTIKDVVLRGYSIGETPFPLGPITNIIGIIDASPAFLDGEIEPLSTQKVGIINNSATHLVGKIEP